VQLALPPPPYSVSWCLRTFVSWRKVPWWRPTLTSRCQPCMRYCFMPLSFIIPHSHALWVCLPACAHVCRLYDWQHLARDQAVTQLD
jgi:hypothetical protein